MSFNKENKKSVKKNVKLYGTYLNNIMNNICSTATVSLVKHGLVYDEGCLYVLGGDGDVSLRPSSLAATVRQATHVLRPSVALHAQVGDVRTAFV